MKVFHYKGFIGSIDVDPQDKCLYGKLLYVNDLITYEATTVAKLEFEFKQAVNDYLDTCKALNREPMKPFKGSLNVRIGQALHKEVAVHAAMCGITLNEYIKMALQQQISRENRRQASSASH